MVEIIFKNRSDEKFVTQYSRDVINDVCEKAGVKTVTVTSVQRSALEQASAMYYNCVTSGAASQFKLYGAYGDKVVQVYVDHARGGHAQRDVVIAAMAAKIEELGPSNVSKHCVKDWRLLNVVDISASRIPKDRHDELEAAIKDDERIERHFSPYTEPVDPAFHLEIPQPKEA